MFPVSLTSILPHNCKSGNILTWLKPPLGICSKAAGHKQPGDVCGSITPDSAFGDIGNIPVIVVVRVAGLDGAAVNNAPRLVSPELQVLFPASVRGMQESRHSLIQILYNTLIIMLLLDSLGRW